MQMDGDLADLQNAFGGVGRRQRNAASVAAAAEASGFNGTWGSRCSMLAKVNLVSSPRLCMRCLFSAIALRGELWTL